MTLNISHLTCWGQSGWQWCCSSRWRDAHIPGPEMNLTRQGPGFSLTRYCRSLQHSLCCSLTTTAAVSGSPGEGSAPLSYRKSHLCASGLKSVPSLIHFIQRILCLCVWGGGVKCRCTRKSLCNLHNEISSEAHQCEQNVFEGGR